MHKGYTTYSRQDEQHFPLLVCFIKLLVLLPVASGFTSGFGLKTSGLLPEVSGNRKFLKLQLAYFQHVILFLRKER